VTSALADTNILLRLAQKSSPHYSVARFAVTTLRRSGCVIFIVPQNIVEFWSVATRPIASNGLGYSPGFADRLMQRLQRFLPLVPDSSLIHEEWQKLVVSIGITGRQAHDARLVAAMIVHGIPNILTFNLADFRRYPGITTIDPAAVSSGP
jgi:predicted nucleic acid-binding protein